MNSTCGFRLQRMEIYNWGNFQDLQVVDFASDETAFGPLVKLKNNAIVAGINGAGKTTLMDAYFLTLLPYENRLRLGVVADSDKGASRGAGGRNAASYVLGKHSAGGKRGGVNPADLYSRKTDMSAVLLIFKHNGTGKFVSVGRLWWYSDWVVKEDRGYIVAQEELSINNPNLTNLLDQSGHPFGSAKQFRKGMKTKGAKVDTPETGRDYFQTYRTHLGNITEEDIILLNKAFYLKSIDNIDGFIRDNMLVEITKDSIDRLLGNIAKAKEITHTIDTEEAKLKISKELVENLELLERNFSEISRLRMERKLSDALGPYRNLKEARIALDNAKESLSIVQKNLPLLSKDAEKRSQEYERAATLLAQSSAGQALNDLEKASKEVAEEIEKMSTEKKEVTTLCHNVQLSPPKDQADVVRFHRDVKEKKALLLQQAEGRNDNLVNIRIDIREAQKVKSDLEDQRTHFGKSRTLLHSDLYDIKLRCAQELGIDNSLLMFVGELIQIPSENENYRIAVESALAPISQNLLIHPDVLNEVSQWINKNGLKRTLRAKRISPKELQQVSTIGPAPENSILHKFEIRSANENVFFHYLSKWLRDHYWHPIVAVEDFNKGYDCAVTIEGLVKSDPRSMVKPSANMRFVLGWDNTFKCVELDAEIAAISAKINSLKKRENELQTVELQNALILALQNLETVQLTFLSIKSKEEELVNIKNRIKSLSKGNEYDELKKNRDQAKESYVAAVAKESECSGNIEDLKKSIELNTNKISIYDEEFNKAKLTKTNGSPSILEWFGSDTKLLEEIEKIDIELRRDSKSIIDHNAAIDSGISNIENTNPPLLGQIANRASEFKEISKNQNLIYKTPPADEISAYTKQWKKVVTDVEGTGLPQAKRAWLEFFTEKLIEATRSAIDDIFGERESIKNNIAAINDVLRGVNFETFEGKERFLQIEFEDSGDHQVRQFRAIMNRVGEVIRSKIRLISEDERPKAVMAELTPFFDFLQDVNIREKVTDARTHFEFSAASFEKNEDGTHERRESFAGASSDGKSSGQTAQISYALLASSLAYRLHFSNEILGRDTLRVFAMDEFTGKFDSEKPQDVMRLLERMGFQAVALTPMSKVETLKEHTNKIVLVFKRNTIESVIKVRTMITDEDKSAIDELLAGVKAEQENLETTDA